ncbi:hypothetical protein VTK73DRAFT_591 [Phialemonium thermophilum]|uniref:Uncharacterized protein n=1 Tax=Phialemonium thermophilum TaxID=223376 RepID=A0ABR3VUN1_9PEZI
MPDLSTLVCEWPLPLASTAILRANTATAPTTPTSRLSSRPSASPIRRKTCLWTTSPSPTPTRSATSCPWAATSRWSGWPATPPPRAARRGRTCASCSTRLSSPSRAARTGRASPARWRTTRPCSRRGCRTTCRRAVWRTTCPIRSRSSGTTTRPRRRTTRQRRTFRTAERPWPKLWL